VTHTYPGLKTTRQPMLQRAGCRIKLHPWEGFVSAGAAGKVK
jgi:hypothetical protein